MENSKLLQVTLPYFCCGITVQGEFVTDAAPIMRWAVGKTWGWIENWIIRKGGKYEEVRLDQ